MAPPGPSSTGRPKFRRPGGLGRWNWHTFKRLATPRRELLFHAYREKLVVVGEAKAYSLVTYPVLAVLLFCSWCTFPTGWVLGWQLGVTSYVIRNP